MVFFVLFSHVVIRGNTHGKNGADGQAIFAVELYALLSMSCEIGAGEEGRGECNRVTECNVTECNM